MFVFGDLGTFTTDTAGTIDACLCLGAAPASALGYFLAHNRPVIAIIGDAAFMHSGVIGVYEIIRRQADVKVIIIDNGASVSTGGQITGDIDTVIGGLPSTLRLHIAETNISERLSCALAKPGPQIVAVRTT